MNKVSKVLIIIVISCFVLSVFKDFLIQSVVTTVASQVLGAPVHIDHLAVGLTRSTVRIKGFRIDNPSGFPQGTLVDIPEISVDYDLPSILRGHLHLPYVVFNLKEMDVVRNADGQLNVDALKIIPKKGEAQNKPASAAVSMAIDTAVLNLGQVVVKDYSKQPMIIEAFDIGVRNKTFRNITSAQQLASLVLVNGMGPTAIKSAAIYGAAAFLGVAFLPAGVAGVLLSKDSAVGVLKSNYDHVYDTLLEIIKSSGQLHSEDKSKGIMKGKVDGADIGIEVLRQSNQETEVKIFARKTFLARPEIANGLMYQLRNKIE